MSLTDYEEPEEMPSLLKQALTLGTYSSNTETEVDRMIRLGEMTPFGTVIPTAEPPPLPPQPQGPKVVKVDTSAPVSDFDKYLLDQGSKAVNKKKGSLSRKRSHTDIGHAPDVDGGYKNDKGRDRTKSKSRNDDPNSRSRTKKMRSSESEPNLVYRDSPPERKNSDGGSFDAISKASRKNLSSPHKNIFDAKDKRKYRPDETDFSGWKSRGRRGFSRLEHNFSGDSKVDVGEDGMKEDDDGYRRRDRDTDYRPEASEEEEEEWEGIAN